MSVTADTITDERIREFRDSLPEVTDEEFAAGGLPFSPARWRRVCHAALGASNANSERGFIAAEINRRNADDPIRDEQIRDLLAIGAISDDLARCALPLRTALPGDVGIVEARARCAEILNAGSAK